MASRDLNDLDPRMQPLVRSFLSACDASGIPLLVTCTYRSSVEQDALYAQGRTTPGAIVTHARGGQSKHNATIDGKPASQAVDIVPMMNGKPVWDTYGESGKLWEEVGGIGEQIGLDWAGRWVHMREEAHFQLKV